MMESNKRQKALFKAMRGETFVRIQLPGHIPDEVEVLGDVPALAAGAINPMWAIEKRLPAVAKRLVPILRATEPRKEKRILFN